MITNLIVGPTCELLNILLSYGALIIEDDKNTIEVNLTGKTILKGVRTNIGWQIIYDTELRSLVKFIEEGNNTFLSLCS